MLPNNVIRYCKGTYIILYIQIKLGIFAYLGQSFRVSLQNTRKSKKCLQIFGGSGLHGMQYIYNMYMI